MICTVQVQPRKRYIMRVIRVPPGDMLSYSVQNIIQYWENTVYQVCHKYLDHPVGIDSLSEV